MSPMLEKAGRAIAEQDGSRFRGVSLFDANPKLYTDLARAALLAIRDLEGGSAVSDALFNLLYSGEMGEDFSTIEVWKAGIDAILGESS